MVIADVFRAIDSEPSPNVTSLDLAAIVIPPEFPRTEWCCPTMGEGPAALEQLPLFPDTAAELLAAPGFVDGRWSRYAGSAEDFEPSRGFIIDLGGTVRLAGRRHRRLLNLIEELQSDDHYGWGIGEDAGLGDQGTCLEWDNPQLGGLHETICLWRQGPLIMVVGGGSDNESPIQVDAAAMDARADALIR